ncbi:MAG: hypothetical protein ACXWAT_14705 [Methylobacter sp.]
MVEFAITVVLIALLISAILYFSRRKKSSSGYTSNEPVKYAPKEPLKKEAKYPPQQEKQPLTTKPAEKNAVNVEASPVVNPQVADAKAVSSPAPEPASKIETPAKPQVEEPISAVKASNTVNSQVTDTKVVSSQKPEPVSTSTSKVEAPAKPQVQEAASTVKASGFPEESVLKRHYFYHLCTMIEELAPQCPTESVLRRHHYTMLATRIGQCLHDKKALEQLTYDYEHRSA